MKIEIKNFFTIISTAMHEMKKHPEDFKTTYPLTKEIFYKIFTEWINAEEIYIDKMPF